MFLGEYKEISRTEFLEKTKDILDKSAGVLKFLMNIDHIDDREYLNDIAKVAYNNLNNHEKVYDGQLTYYAESIKKIYDSTVDKLEDLGEVDRYNAVALEPSMSRHLMDARVQAIEQIDQNAEAMLLAFATDYKYFVSEKDDATLAVPIEQFEDLDMQYRIKTGEFNADRHKDTGYV